MAEIRILVVDDHTVVRDGLTALLGYQKEFEVVASVGSGEEAIAAYADHQPDVVLLDLQLPDMDGVVVLERIRSAFAEVKVLVLTTYQGDEDLFRAFKAGALGYLLKDCSAQVLIESIQRVARGEKVIPPGLEQALEARGPALSQREREVLALAVEGLSNREIGHRLFVTEATVKAHLLHLYTKLEVSDRVEMVRVAVRRGLARL